MAPAPHPPPASPEPPASHPPPAAHPTREMPPHAMVNPAAPQPMALGTSQAHELGATTLVVGIGTLLGTRYAGLYGALAGSLFGGALVNAWRAYGHLKKDTEESDREALVSGSYAAITVALASYLAYRAEQTFVKQEEKKS